MHRYDPEKLLISLHIPKTAGSSLRAALTGWFGDKLALHYRGARGEPPALADVRPGMCIHGHFNRLRGIGALQFYPQASQFIVFLRNPFDRFVSQWRYLHFQRRQGILTPELERAPDFTAWLDARRRAAEAGEDPFSFLAQLPTSVRDAREAAELFGRFLFVGVVEHYGASLAALGKVLARPEQPPIRVNAATDAFRQGDPSDDMAGFRAAHERAFPFEYEVYEAGRRRAAEAAAMT
jgi:hypothetical protein